MESGWRWWTVRRPWQRHRWWYGSASPGWPGKGCLRLIQQIKPFDRVAGSEVGEKGLPVGLVHEGLAAEIFQYSRVSWRKLIKSYGKITENIRREVGTRHAAVAPGHLHAVVQAVLVGTPWIPPPAFSLPDMDAGRPADGAQNSGLAGTVLTSKHGDGGLQGKGRSLFNQREVKRVVISVRVALWFEPDFPDVGYEWHHRSIFLVYILVLFFAVILRPAFCVLCSAFLPVQQRSCRCRPGGIWILFFADWTTKTFHASHLRNSIFQAKRVPSPRAYPRVTPLTERLFLTLMSRHLLPLANPSSSITMLS